MFASERPTTKFSRPACGELVEPACRARQSALLRARSFRPDPETKNRKSDAI